MASNIALAPRFEDMRCLELWPNSWINPTWNHSENGQNNFYSFYMSSSSIDNKENFFSFSLCILSFFMLVLSSFSSFIPLPPSQHLTMKLLKRWRKSKNWNNFYITKHDVKKIFFRFCFLNIFFSSVPLS